MNLRVLAPLSLLLVAGVCGLQQLATVNTAARGPAVEADGSSIRSEGPETIVSGNVVFDGQPRSIDVLVLPFEGASIHSAEDRSRRDRAGLYLLSTTTVNQGQAKVVVVPKDCDIGASRCVVELEAVPGGPRKGRAPLLVLDEDPDLRGAESLLRPPLDDSAAAARIANLAWAADRRVEAKVESAEEAVRGLERATVRVLTRVPDLEKAELRSTILREAERRRGPSGSPAAIPSLMELNRGLSQNSALKRYEVDSRAVWGRRAGRALDRNKVLRPWMVDVLKDSGQLSRVLDKHSEVFIREFRARLNRVSPRTGAPLLEIGRRTMSDADLLDLMRGNTDGLESMIRRGR